MVATWWCGQKKEMDYCDTAYDALEVKKIDRMIGSQTGYRKPVILSTEKRILRTADKSSALLYRSDRKK
jgi:hypothetical protein